MTENKQVPLCPLGKLKAVDLKPDEKALAFNPENSVGLHHLILYGTGSCVGTNLDSWDLQTMGLTPDEIQRLNEGEVVVIHY